MLISNLHFIIFFLGFTICGQSLDRMALTHYILQYTIIIIPIIIICALVFICQLGKTRFEIKEQSFFEQRHEKLMQSSGN